ncbi:MAG: PD-(D/E)XK nuclease family protein, partial [Candidatus Omnitrophica bacterium]|nr:PD-(D/E)XK nuclease family protein [Candidatus Omnitrophota bacterium]
ASGLDSNQVKDFLFELGKRRRKEKNVYYYRKFREEFSGVWDEFIADFFKNVGFVPLYELAVSIIGRFKILQNFPEYQGFFMRLLELINEQEEEHSTVGEFLDFFDQARDEDLYVNISEVNSVRVLTIHKSKGLEFRAVITPNLTLDIDIKTNIVYPEENFLSLLRLKKEYVKFSPSLERIYRREFIKAFIDELNNIYVAFTRARDELYVFVPLKNGNKFNYAQLLFNSLDYIGGSFSDNAETGKTQSSNLDIFNIPPVQYRDWIPFLKEEFVSLDILENRQILLQGEALHLVLSFLGNLKGKNIDSTVDEAIDKAMWKLPLRTDSQKLKALVRQFLDRSSWARFFFIDHGSVFQEKEFVNNLGQTKRIDRLVVKEEEILVCDYKSSPDLKEKFLPQMLEYTGILKEVYPGARVKGYILYFDRPDIEEING